MAAAAVALFRIYDLPWSTGREQDDRFRRIVRTALGAVLALSVLLWLLPQPARDDAQVQEVPKRLVKLVLDREVPKPKPPPPVVTEQPKPEPEKLAEQKPVQKPVEKPKPEPPKPVDTTQQAREKAKVAGLLPFANQLAALRDDKVAEQLDRKNLVGSGATNAPLAERSQITSRVGNASRGINTAALSRNTGGNGLAGRSTTQVENPVEGFEPVGGAAQRSGDSDKPSRSREEIERTFDRNKGAIYAIYNRALRNNPALQGKIVLRLTIAPDGHVTFCEIVSSELGDPELEQKLIQRVLLFEFEQKNVESITTTKPIDFFPA
ncbi:MAG TPA: AgmX/PglI C-terminal domain-containing protein [Gammaproteobacteria bacterium]|nr:AgmX/PglI C-terminal domain-containing protein [Gammaproteobacteria bacterium]